MGRAENFAVAVYHVVWEEPNDDWSCVYITKCGLKKSPTRIDVITSLLARVSPVEKRLKETEEKKRIGGNANNKVHERSNPIAVITSLALSSQ